MYVAWRASFKKGLVEKALPSHPGWMDGWDNSLGYVYLGEAEVEGNSAVYT